MPARYHSQHDVLGVRLRDERSVQGFGCDAEVGDAVPNPCGNFHVGPFEERDADLREVGLEGPQWPRQEAGRGAPPQPRGEDGRSPNPQQRSPAGAAEPPLPMPA